MIVEEVGKYRAHDAAVPDVTADHVPLRIGDTHVQMRSILRDRSGQGQDFEVAVQRIGLRCAGKAQVGTAQTADSRNDERCTA